MNNIILTLPQNCLTVINGKTILEWCISSLQLPGRYFFAISNDAKVKELDEIGRRSGVDYNITVLEPPLGQAHAALMVTDIIKKRFGFNHEPLIITNAQYTPWNQQRFFDFVNIGYDGIVTTYPFEGVEENCPSSYNHVRLAEGHEGLAVEFADHFAIGLSLAGLYYFRDVNEFRASAIDLMREDGPKSVSLLCNHAIRHGATIAPYRLEWHEFVPLSNDAEIEENSRLVSDWNS